MITVAAKGRIRGKRVIKETSKTTELLVTKNKVVETEMVNSNQFQNIGDKASKCILMEYMGDNLRNE